MALWNWFTGLFDHSGIADTSPPHQTNVNPATGLPMIGGVGGIDLAGNPYGANHDHWHAHGHWSRGGGFDNW